MPNHRRPLTLALATPLVAALAATSVRAQLPADGVIVLEQTAAVIDPCWSFADAFGRGASRLRGQNVFAAFASVAADPADAGRFYYQSTATSLAGTWTAQVQNLARIGTNVWGSLSRTGGERVDVGTTRIATLRGRSIVDVVLKTGGTPTAVLTGVVATDLALAEPLLFVATTAGVLELDLRTNAQRTVTAIAGSALAVSPLGGEVALGMANGDVLRIDTATGATTQTIVTGLGPIVAVGYTRFGTLVWGDTGAIVSELAPSTPVFVAARPILDFAVTTATVATSVPYGRGCGVGAAAVTATNGAPTLGNANWRLLAQSLPAATPAVFVLGASRSFATAFAAALPFDLGALGAPGCLLLADPAVVLFASTSATGTAQQAVPIPAAPALAGSEFAAQWLVAAPGANALGLAATDAVAFVPR